MTRIDFYLLVDAGISVDRMTCRIADKARLQGNSVYIHAETEEQARLLDNSLWTFRDIVFAPHALLGVDGSVPIVIGWPGHEADNGDTLIRLGEMTEEKLGQFSRVVEIIADDEGERTTARQRYRSYRDKGFVLHHHNIGQGTIQQQY